MNKRISLVLTALMLSLMMIVPAAGGLAEVGQEMKKDLPADKLANLTITANGLGIHLRETEDAPYAEMDATVLGINSADVDYGFDVSETANGLEINAHHTGRTIGIDYVKLNIYLPKDAVETLTLNLTDSEITHELLHSGVSLKSIEGTIDGGKLTATDLLGSAIKLQTTNTDVNLKGEMTNIDVSANGGNLKFESTVVPEAITVNSTDTDVDVKVPETIEGFTVTYKITSGKFSTDYAEGYSEEDGSVAVGNGVAPFNFTVTNGTLVVKK